MDHGKQTNNGGDEESTSVRRIGEKPNGSSDISVWAGLFQNMAEKIEKIADETETSSPALANRLHGQSEAYACVAFTLREAMRPGRQRVVERIDMVQILTAIIGAAASATGD